MGAALSLNKKAVLHEYQSLWNLKHRENTKTFHCKCCYQVGQHVTRDITEQTPPTSCESVAAYLQKCAYVGKRRIKSKIEPAPSGKNYFFTNDTEKKGLANFILAENTQNIAKPKTEKSKSLHSNPYEISNILTEPKSPQTKGKLCPPSFTVANEALRCIANFVKSRNKNISRLKQADVVLWLRGVDRALLLQGWQDQAFLTPSNLVFLYMLLKETFTNKVLNILQLRAEILTCLYLAYTYNGAEISYPLKPFLVDGDRKAFWDRCMAIISELSDKMLKINREPKYFTEMLGELKCFSCFVERRDG